MATDQERYIYEPLQSPTAIRLIKFSINPGDSSVICDLHHVEQATAPPYDALSYTWGDSSQRTTLVCGGRTISITAALAQALPYIIALTTRYFWIDQISVNQGDLDERGVQVALMKDVFFGADTVWAWLGLDDLVAINSFNANLEFLYNADNLRHPFEPEYVDALCRSTTFIPKFFNKPWFRRIWVIQEIAWAKRAFLIVGHEQNTKVTLFEWDFIGRTAQSCIMYVAERYSLEGSDDQEMQTGVACIRNCAQMYAATHGVREGNLKDLDTLLPAFRNFLSTDPRDKVFAILGLASKSSLQVPSLEAFANPDIVDTTGGRYSVLWLDADPGRIRVVPPSHELQANYNQHLPQVSRDYTINTIRKQLRLDVLSFVDHGDNINIPSWVPRWDQPHRIPFSSGSIIQSQKYLFHHKPLYLVPLMLGESHDENILCLKGNHVATVRRSTVVEVDSTFLEPIMNLLTSTLADLEGIYLTGEKPHTALLATLALGRGNWGMRLNLLNPRLPSSIESFGESLRNSYHKWGLSLMISMLAQTPKIAGSRFFIADHYIGIGSPALRIGDRIVNLFGSTVPFILRPTAKVGCQNAYLLIGSFYVHGIMRGELCSDVRSAQECFANRRVYCLV